MYSQNKEEEVIIRYFEGLKDTLPEGESPTFLSVGENDGETLSNVRELALSGWSGVMIEPAPTAFRKLKNLYSAEKKGRFYIYELALGNHNGTATLHDSGTLLKTGDTSLVSTLVEDEKKRFQATVSYEPIVVKVFRWKTFLNRCKLKKFHCVSIDAESMDLDILIQMDLTDVRLLIIEWNGSEPLKQAYSEYCAKYGLTRIIYTSAENLIFAR